MGKAYMGYDKTPPKNIRVISTRSANADIRYVLVDADTGELFDDAQGYGYKSEEKAVSAFRYGVYRRQQCIESGFSLSLS